MSLKLSIITPVYNGRKYITSYIQGVRSQTTDTDTFEVIIVDNGSNDDSLELLQAAGNDFQNWNIIQFTEKRGSYAARNHGVKHASSEILAFTDIDCITDSNWVNRIISHNELLRDGYIISGDVHLFPEQDPPNCYERYDSMTSMNQELYSTMQFGATANLATSRKTFNRLNGFSEVTSGADREFCQRAKDRGTGFSFKKDVVVKHPARNTYSMLASKERRIGKGKAQLCKQKKGALSGFFLFLKTLAAMILQRNQWKLILNKELTGLNPNERIRFAILTFKLGVIGRWSILKHLIHNYPDSTDNG